MGPMSILIIGILTILAIRICAKLGCIKSTNEFWIRIIRGISIRVIVHIIKIVHALLLLLAPRLVLVALLRTVLGGGVARVRRARAHGRGAVKLVARALLERRH